MSKPVVMISGCRGVRDAATRLALLDMAQAAALAMASMPPEAFERRGVVIDSASQAYIPEIVDLKPEPPPAKKKWPSSSRQRFGGKR